MSAAFFAAVRSGILGPTLDQDEVDGCNAILTACKGWPTSWTAYALATAYHETAGTMQPIKEYGGDKYFTRLYDVKGQDPARARKYGNTTPGDGPRYCGRGYVQLTWKANYAKAAAKTGYALVDRPDLAHRPDIAAVILRHGMADGWFTGKKLSDYLSGVGNGTASQFIQCRRIINGVDKASMIAGYALQFQAALSAR